MLTFYFINTRTSKSKLPRRYSCMISNYWVLFALFLSLNEEKAPNKMCGCANLESYTICTNLVPHTSRDGQNTVFFFRETYRWTAFSFKLGKNIYSLSWWEETRHRKQKSKEKQGKNWNPVQHYVNQPNLPIKISVSIYPQVATIKWCFAELSK